MPRLEILAGPDRFSFASSMFDEIDSMPMPGYLSPPQARGGIQPPSYLGELFRTRNGEGKERELWLIIASSKRSGRSGLNQEFTAVLWAACDEFRDLIPMGSQDVWVEFKGELDFATQHGWLERV